MALVSCQECGKQVSDKAAACPGCGAPPSSAVIAPVAHHNNASAKGSIFARLVMWMVIGVGVIVALFVLSAVVAGILENPVSDAQSVIDRQLANDLRHEFDQKNATYTRLNGNVYVCSTILLNRPGTGPLAMDNVRQRVIVTMYRTGAGLAIMDGRTDPVGQAEFASDWAAHCR